MAVTGPKARATASFAVAGDGWCPLQLGHHAIVDGRAVVHRLGRELPAQAADLVEIAASIHAVDRLVRRPGGSEGRVGTSWARRLMLRLPVRMPDLWNAHADRLAALLEWLTDDSWVFEFHALPAGAGSLDQPQGFLFDTVPAGSVPVLFSGGIDSAAGLAAELTRGELATAISEQPFRIDAPALTATKAQALRSAPGNADRALALTVSCDAGFAARVPDHAPCGACTSCLLRRQALHAAGRAGLDAGGAYLHRKGSSPAGTLQVMLWQVSRLRTCLAQPDPWLALVAEFPEVLDTAPLTPAEVVGLYRAYVREWEGLEGGFGPGGQAGRHGRTAA